MKLKDFMELVNYQITDSSKFEWNCYGPNAVSFDYWNGIHGSGGRSIQVVFDSVTSQVYEMQAWDYKADREYRWINPMYIDSVKEESVERGVSFESSFDGRSFIDLDLEQDILEKASAIYAGREYDTRIMISVELSDQELFAAMRSAHEQDITLNDYIERVLQQEVNRLKNEQKTR